MFLTALFICDVILEADLAEAFELIPIVLVAAAEFNIIHEDDEDFKDKALSHAEDFTLWAYGVGSGRITETIY